MSRFLKPTLSSISIVLLTALSACISFTVMEDPQNSVDVAAEIADFDVPAGFTSELNLHMLGYTVASYRGESSASHLYLIQSEKESDVEELERMLKELAPGSSDPNSGSTVIENRQVTVRGQDATLVISEGASSEDVPYRQATVAFAGKGGPALLVFSETVEDWDTTKIEEFLASIQ